MDSEQNKTKVLKDFKAAQATQSASVRDAESRRKIRKARIYYGSSSAIVAIFFGWMAFIIGKMNQISAGPHIPIAAAFGAALALAYTIRKERVLREESAQVRRVISLRGFSTGYNRLMLWCFAIFGSIFVLISVGAPLAENYYPQARISRFIDRHLLYVLGVAFSSLIAFFYVGLSKLYRVKCPNCHSRLRVRSRRHELEDTYSGLCKSCGTLWDLDIGNSD